MSVLVEAKDLKKYFPLKAGFFKRTKKVVHAVDGVSLQIQKGEIFGLIGESGCGKSTTARLLLRLIEPTAGSVLFNGQDLFGLDKDKILTLRREMQIIHQNPYASLNPRKDIFHILSQPYAIHRLCAKGKVRHEVLDLLKSVRLEPPEYFIDRYPHELSGGQRQRIVIARTLALDPKFVVADEPVSALDVSIQGQILNLIKNMKKEKKISFLYITHDLATPKSICDRIAVMYLGKLVELGNLKEVYDKPLHPYTEALLSAAPVSNPRQRDRRRIILTGDVPSPIDLPSGCRFHTRCPYKQPVCTKIEPDLVRKGTNHYVACNLRI